MFYVNAPEGPDGELVYREATPDELADFAALEQAAAAAVLAGAQASRVDEVKQLLAASDRYVRIAVETGQPMTAAQLAYRDALRQALATVAASADPAGVQLPDPPPDEGG